MVKKYSKRRNSKSKRRNSKSKRRNSKSKRRYNKSKKRYSRKKQMGGSLLPANLNPYYTELLSFLKESKWGKKHNVSDKDDDDEVLAEMHQYIEDWNETGENYRDKPIEETLDEVVRLVEEEEDGADGDKEFIKGLGELRHPPHPPPTPTNPAIAADTEVAYDPEEVVAKAIADVEANAIPKLDDALIKRDLKSALVIMNTEGRRYGWAMRGYPMEEFNEENTIQKLQEKADEALITELQETADGGDARPESFRQRARDLLEQIKLFKTDMSGQGGAYAIHLGRQQQSELAKNREIQLDKDKQQFDLSSAKKEAELDKEKKKSATGAEFRTKFEATEKDSLANAAIVAKKTSENERMQEEHAKAIAQIQEDHAEVIAQIQEKHKTEVALMKSTMEEAKKRDMEQQNYYFMEQMEQQKHVFMEQMEQQKHVFTEHIKQLNEKERARAAAAEKEKARHKGEVHKLSESLLTAESKGRRSQANVEELTTRVKGLEDMERYREKERKKEKRRAAARSQERTEHHDRFQQKHQVWDNDRIRRGLDG